MSHSNDEYLSRIQAALRAAESCIFEVDITNQRYTFFENPESIFHKSSEQILAELEAYSALPPEEYKRCVSEYFSHPGDAEVIDKAFQAIFRGCNYTYEARMKAGDSDFTWCRIYVAPVIENGVPVKMTGFISNIQMTRERMDMLENAVYQDPFTKLYTKNRLRELTDLILDENPHLPCVMLMIDLDHFKAVNDTYGHNAGDEVLLSISKHLKSLFRKTDIVARFGGDEFTILMVDCTPDDAEKKARELLTREDNSYGVTKSIGVAAHGQGDNTFDALFEKADSALYLAKQTRNAYRVFRPHQETEEPKG